MDSNLDHTGLSRERELELEVARLTAELEALGGGDPAQATARLLEMAAATADAVVADARREADEIIVETSAEAEARRDEATRVAAEAEAMAERKLAEADEAQEIVDRANQDADAIRESAERDAAEIVAAGRQASAAESAHLDESRAALAAEREALTSFHESLQRRVRELAESMVTFMSAELPGTTALTTAATTGLGSGWTMPADDPGTEITETELTEPEPVDTVVTEITETEPVDTEVTEPVETEITETEAADTEPAETEIHDTEVIEATEPVDVESDELVDQDSLRANVGLPEQWGEPTDDDGEPADETDEADVVSDGWPTMLEAVIPDEEPEPATAGPWGVVTPVTSDEAETTASTPEFGGAPVVETDGDAVIDEQPVDRFDKVTPSGSGLFARLWRGSAPTQADDFSDLSGGDELEQAPAAPAPAAESGLFDMFGSGAERHVQPTSPDVLAEALEHDDDHDAAFDDFLRGDEAPDPSRDWLLRPENG